MKNQRFNSIGSFSLATIVLFLASGLTQVFAQPRYSANVVGYSDADFVAGSNLVANPFDAGNNTISNLFAGVPSGSFFLPWNRSSAAFGPTNHFTSQGGWTDGAATLLRPDGGFLWLPAPKRISFVGELWPPMCVTFPPGPSVSGVFPLYVCGFCASFDGCPMNPPDFTIVFKWDRLGQRFTAFDYSIDYGWDPIMPTLAPDEAVVFHSPMAFTAQSPGLHRPTPVSLFNPSRAGNDLIFQFPSAGRVNYSVQRSLSLSPNVWRTILNETASPTGGVITVTVPAGASHAAFYRVHTLRLLNPSRTGTQFQFQFHADEGVAYQVSKSSSLGSGSWQPVLTIEGTGALVTATDPAATNPTSYYRLEY